MMKQIVRKNFLLNLYSIQSKKWPQQGNHIMAQFDEQTIIVYQAYNPQITQAIIKSQNFHSPLCKKVGYNMERMTWIKPNFLWMMYRSGWATKANQERILAIRLKRSGFQQILSKAVLSKVQTSKNNTPSKDDPVRLQWDPDHLPNGIKHPKRRAIQLGLRGPMLQKMSKQFIVQIDDITNFVTENRKFIENYCQSLQVPIEKVYKINDQKLAQNIGVSKFI